MGAEKAGLATAVVKTTIVCSICNSYGAEAVNLKGKQTMHFILRGSIYLSPEILLLLPSQEENISSLDISRIGIDLNKREALLKSLKVQE